MSCKLAKNATSHTKIQSCYPELDLKGQRVAIVGLGKSRSAAMKLALARGASVIVVDQNLNLGSTFKLNGWLDEKDGDLKTVFGNFDNKLLKEADIVVVSPGVPLQNYGLFSIISSGVFEKAPVIGASEQTSLGRVKLCQVTEQWVQEVECPLPLRATSPSLMSSKEFPILNHPSLHRRHHSNTGSLDRDEVFVPKMKSSMKWFSTYLNNPPGRILVLVVQLTLGWPLYLMFNVSGRPYDRFACHFDPNSPIYTDRERLQIFVSDAGIFAVLYGLYSLVTAKGLTWVACLYGCPLLIVNGFLVLITYLQHTHLSLPHYDSSEWDWLRGALATVDRDYGILNKVFHNITDTHVAHHLFSTMPHYHAMEATKAIKPILGDYYQFDGTSIWKAMYREAKECVYVEPDEGDQNKGVFWYKNKLH
ncbi:hypothetical protein K7X08_014983 [Anisodus acutangulus]|uniref:Fatty acid desaturase domain-containing protein n=1 Tax=Anisodus acutangulus TaxID=402998 RepID=A0A9Q1L1H1_9SOLA|nr:hypothetical protein K7X08_014983 [Anisodus acutangulus]